MSLKRWPSLLFIIVFALCCRELWADTLTDPDLWAQGTVSPSLQLPQTSPQWGEGNGSGLAVASPVSSQSNALSVASIPLEPSSVSASPLYEEEDLETGVDGEGEEDDDLALIDPAAVDEALILTEDQSDPPEDEGASIAVTELQFDFPVVENQKVQYYIDYFTGPGRNAFSRWLERTPRYLPYMQEVFAAQGLPRDLVYLSIVESGLNPKAYSWAHASGLWQFIPSTGKIFGLDADYWRDERRDFEKSTQAAALFLKELYELFDGNWYLAVAAYNAGPGAVTRAIERSGTTDFWEMAHHQYLPEETRNYVPKLLAVLLIAKQLERYGFTEVSYQEPIACDKVTVEGPVDLAVVARLSGSSYSEIKALNPELKRWCTPPSMESYQLNLPSGTRDAFLVAYDELPRAERREYKIHKVNKGETLKSLAKENRLSVDEILRANSLVRAKMVKVGSNLLIPLRSGVEAIPREDLFEDPIIVKTAKGRTYKVKKGDTLSRIARRHGVTLAQLKSWNRMTGKSRLRIGQVIQLGPGKNSSHSLATTAKAPTKKSSAKGRGKSSSEASKIVYRVKKGDTVYKIARQYAVKPAQVLSWNGLDHEHVLQPGQNLTLRVQGRKGG